MAARGHKRSGSDKSDEPAAPTGEETPFIYSDGSTGEAPGPDSGTLESWRRELADAAAPARRLESAMAELTAAFSNAQITAQSAAGDLEAHLLRELRIMQASLQQFLETQTQEQQTAEHNHRAVGRQLQEFGTTIQELVNDNAESRRQREDLRRTLQEGQDSLTTGLEALGEELNRAETATSERNAELRRVVGQAFEALEASAQRATGDLTGRLDQSDERMNTALGEISARLDRTAQESVRLAGLMEEVAQRSESGAEAVARVETAARKSAAAQEAARAAAEQSAQETQEIIRAQLAGLPEALRGLRSELAETVERNHNQLSQRVETAIAGIAGALTTAAESAGQAEARLLRQLESVESRTMQAIAEMRAGMAEDRRSMRFELKNRIDQGVIEPLKEVVSLLNQQLTDIKSSMERITGALHSADITIRLDDVDTLLEKKFRSYQASNLVELSSRNPQEAKPNDG